MSAPILSLPTKLLSLILSSCDYAAALAFSMTCKQLNEFAIHRKYSMADLLHIECWPCYDRVGQAEDHMKQPWAGWDCFACCLCLRIRSAVKFSNAMMKGKRGKPRRTDSGIQKTRSGRICIDCGIQRGIYQRGAILSFGGSELGYLDDDIGGRGLVCSRCRSFSRLSRVEGREPRFCKACSPTSRLGPAGRLQTANSSDPDTSVCLDPFPPFSVG